jgi:hypothetical protein
MKQGAARCCLFLPPPVQGRLFKQPSASRTIICGESAITVAGAGHRPRSHAERSAQRLVEPVPVDPPLVLGPVPAAPLEPLLLPLKVLPRVPAVVLPDVPVPPIPAAVPLPTEPAPIEPAPPAPPDVPLLPPAVPPPPPAWAKHSVAGPAIRAAAKAVYRVILSILRSFRAAHDQASCFRTPHALKGHQPSQQRVEQRDAADEIVLIQLVCGRSSSVSERAPLETGERSGVAAPTRRCRRLHLYMRAETHP